MNRGNRTTYWLIQNGIYQPMDPKIIEELENTPLTQKQLEEQSKMRSQYESRRLLRYLDRMALFFDYKDKATTVLFKSRSPSHQPRISWRHSI